jgi:hypothetical protein
MAEVKGNWKVELLGGCLAFSTVVNLELKMAE